MSAFPLPPSPLGGWGWGPPTSGQMDASPSSLGELGGVGGWGQVLF